MRPRTSRTTTMTRASPRPPLGAYPQSQLCDHLGKAPQSAKIKTTIRIVPSITFSPCQVLKSGAARCEATPAVSKDCAQQSDACSGYQNFLLHRTFLRQPSAVLRCND